MGGVGTLGSTRSWPWKASNSVYAASQVYTFLPGPFPPAFALSTVAGGVTAPLDAPCRVHPLPAPTAHSSPLIGADGGSGGGGGGSGSGGGALPPPFSSLSGLALHVDAAHASPREALYASDPAAHAIHALSATCALPCANGGHCAAPNLCACPGGWRGVDCTLPTCANPCGARQLCTAPDTCTCIPGYAPWPGTDDCSAPQCFQSCGAHGACTAPDTCTCDPGWFDALCSTPVCAQTCGNGGNCSAPDTCACARGWTGGDCRTPVCPQSCSNGGLCTAPGTCACAEGWDGWACTTPVCHQGMFRPHPASAATSPFPPAPQLLPCGSLTPPTSYAANITATLDPATNATRYAFAPPRTPGLPLAFSDWCTGVQDFACWQQMRAVVPAVYPLPGRAASVPPGLCFAIELSAAGGGVPLLSLEGAEDALASLAAAYTRDTGAAWPPALASARPDFTLQADFDPTLPTPAPAALAAALHALFLTTLNASDAAGYNASLAAYTPPTLLSLHYLLRSISPPALLTPTRTAYAWGDTASTHPWSSPSPAVPDRAIARVAYGAITQGVYVCANGGNCTAPDTCECARGWAGFDCRTPVCEQGYWFPERRDPRPPTRGQGTYAGTSRTLTLWENFPTPTGKFPGYTHAHPNYPGLQALRELAQGSFAPTHTYTPYGGALNALDWVKEGWRLGGVFARLPGATWDGTGLAGSQYATFQRRCTTPVRPPGPPGGSNLTLQATAAPPVADTYAAYAPDATRAPSGYSAQHGWWDEGLGTCTDAVLLGCFNGGVCAAPNVCECARGWEGVDCSLPICSHTPRITTIYSANLSAALGISNQLSAAMAAALLGAQQNLVASGQNGGGGGGGGGRSVAGRPLCAHRPHADNCPWHGSQCHGAPGGALCAAAAHAAAGCRGQGLASGGLERGEWRQRPRHCRCPGWPAAPPLCPARRHCAGARAARGHLPRLPPVPQCRQLHAPRHVHLRKGVGGRGLHPAHLPADVPQWGMVQRARHVQLPAVAQQVCGWAGQAPVWGAGGGQRGNGLDGL